MSITFETYERVSLHEPDTKWELVCGQLREKPPMTTEHEDISRNLAAELILQIDRSTFAVGQQSPKLQTPAGNYRIPDVCVIPRAFIQQRKRDLPARLESYEQPMPLVVEIWSPSTGDKDTDDKLREYQQRGDLEIWLIHPYDRTLTAWRRLTDGSYERQIYRAGRVGPASLPGVSIDLDLLFE